MVSTHSENTDSVWEELNGKTYDIVDTLGKGTYGTVVSAVNKSTGETCAIKLIDSV